MAMLDDFWAKFKAVGSASKKKKDKLGIGKTRGGQTKDADETLKELEKEGKNDYASIDE